MLHGEFEDPRKWQTTCLTAELDLAYNEAAFWPYGTLAELCLVATMIDREQALDQAKDAIDHLVERATDPFAIPSTRDQLLRYTNWWLNEHGFFGNRTDFASEAQELLDHLESITDN